MFKSRRKVRVSRTGTRLFRVLSLVVVGSLISSCSCSSKISVKQSQDEQLQETNIETEGNLQSLNLSFVF